MLYLTFTMIFIVDLAHYGEFYAKDLVSVDCGAMLLSFLYKSTGRALWSASPLALKFCVWWAKPFLTYETECVLFFSSAGKFCLAHGLRQLIRDVTSDIRILNFRSDVTYAPPQKRRMMFEEGCYAM